MWRLASTNAGIVGKVIYDAVKDENTPTSSKPPSGQKSTLEINLDRLEKQLNLQAKRNIAVIGQPGAGKSSLLKKITDGEICPLPIIGIETDATNWANDIHCNLLSSYKKCVFIDVPGYDTSSHPIDAFLSFFPFYRIDVFVFVTHGKLRGADEGIFNLLKTSGGKVIIARSFVDDIEVDERILIESDLRTRLMLQKSDQVIFFSNRSGEGVNLLKTSINEGLKMTKDNKNNGSGGGLFPFPVTNSPKSEKSSWPFTIDPGSDINEFEKDLKSEATDCLIDTAFMRTLTPSSELALIVGEVPLPRTEVISKLWAYIKENDLQDHRNKLQIIADAKLRKIFGKDKFDMFAMTALVDKHLF